MPIWTKKKEVQYTNINGADLTDFQHEVDLSYEAAMQADFGDIRFGNSDGSVLYDFWLQSKTDSSTAKFWINVPLNPDGGVSIYAFYGASTTVESTSDGDETFEFFDDFRDAAPAAAESWANVTGLRDARQAISGVVVEIGNVLYEPADTGKEYKHWYGISGDIFYSYSSDGENWTVHGKVIDSVAGDHEDPFVLNIAGTYWMWIEIADTTIEVRSSADGITWSSPTEVLAPGAEGQWDDEHVASPTVIIEGSTIYLFYEGSNSPAISTAEIGFATCDVSNPAGTYTKEATNPVMIPADTRQDWMLGGWIVPDDLIKIGSTYYMTMHGIATSSVGVWSSIATSTDLLNWTNIGVIPLLAESGRQILTASFFPDDSFRMIYYGATAAEGSFVADAIDSAITLDAAKWTSHINGTSGELLLTGDCAVFVPQRATFTSVAIRSVPTFTNGFIFEQFRSNNDRDQRDVAIGAGDIVEFGGTGQWHHVALKEGYQYLQQSDERIYRYPDAGPGNGTLITSKTGVDNTATKHIDRLTYTTAGDLFWHRDGTQQMTVNDTTFLSNEKRILIHQGSSTSAGDGGILVLNWARVRKWASTQPVATVQPEESGSWSLPVTPAGNSVSLLQLMGLL